MGQYPDAERYYLKHLELLKAGNKQRTEQYAIGLSNIGVLYLEEGLYKKAESYFNQSIDIFKSHLFTDNNYERQVFINLANLYQSTKRPAQAIQLLAGIKSTDPKTTIENYNTCLLYTSDAADD